MSDEFKIVDIWIGTFRSEDDLRAYFDEEAWGGTERALSAFARDQGLTFYDHDFLEVSFNETSDDFRVAASRHSFSESYKERVSESLVAKGTVSFNSIVLLFGGQARYPRSISTEHGYLTYIGAFDCVPAKRGSKM